MNKRDTITALVATGLLATAWGEAAAQCKPGTKMPVNFAPEAAFWEFEGPLVAYDRVARTVTVMGATVEVPLGLPIDVGAGKHITFEEMTDPVLNEKRSIVGGIFIATGNASDPNGDGCMDFVAEGAEFLFSEDVAGGPLPNDPVSADGTTFYVNTVPVIMNTDPRLPSVILDASGNPDITFEHLRDSGGKLVAPEGFFEGGYLHAAVVEADVYVPNATGDNVVIVQARWYPDKLEAKVVGYVEPLGAAYVDIYAPGRLTADGLGCEGTYRARVATFNDPDVATQARFVWSAGKEADPAMPDRVCVKSAGGDANRRDFEPWRRADNPPIVTVEGDE